MCRILRNALKNSEYVPHRNTVCTFITYLAISSDRYVFYAYKFRYPTVLNRARESKTFCPGVLRSKFGWVYFFVLYSEG